MKRLTRFLIIMLSAVSASVSCGPQEEVVPEGVLKIFADRQSIEADGVDCVTFRVMYGSQDVSSEKTMKLVWTSEGRTVEMSAGANKFSTTAAGEYTFKASFYSAGEHWSENEITVSASAVKGQKSYHQYVIGEQFTSVGCTNCPALSSRIKDIQKQMPGVLIPLSFHMDYNMTDPMTTDATAMFYKAYGMTGLPFFNLNMRKRDNGVNREAIREAIEEELDLYPATCGVAIGSSYDETSGEASIVVRITSNVAARYKYHVFLLEDGIEYTQSGATPDYVHDHVVRKMFSHDITGLNINRKEALVPGVEVTAEHKAVLEGGWKPENMRVVVAALTSNDGGITYTCNNANMCALGESVDYLID